MAAAPALAAPPDAADGEECDSSDDEPHDDVVQNAPPFLFHREDHPPDAAHYALSPFPCLLEIQRKSKIEKAKARSTAPGPKEGSTPWF